MYLEQEKNDFDLKLKNKFFSFEELLPSKNIYDIIPFYINGFDKSSVIFFEELITINEKYSFMKIYEIANKQKILFVIGNKELKEMLLSV